MLSNVNGYFLFILCVTKIQIGVLYIPDVQKAKVIDVVANKIHVLPVAQNNAERSVDRFFSNIFIEREERQEKIIIKIYTRNNSSTLYNFDVTFSPTYKLNVLYTCMNCEFGRWITHALFDLIKYLPVYYQTEFKFDGYGREFEKKFNAMNVKLRILAENIDRFIQILFTLIYVEPHTVSSNETTVLHALYALKFKIKYFETLHNKFENRTFDIKNKSLDKVKGSNRTDNVVIAECLKVINAVRKFVFTNCHSYDSEFFPESTTDKKIFNAYSVKSNNNENDFINALLDTAADLQLVHSPENRCSTDQFLLKSVVMQNKNTYYYTNPYGVSYIIGEATVFLAGEKVPTTVNGILERIQLSYDIELIFFYQKSVLNTIMEVVYSKIKALFARSLYLSVDSQEYLLKIREKLKTHPGAFPKSLTDYFDCLVSASTLPINHILQTLNNLKRTATDWFSSIQLPTSIDFSLDEFLDIIIERERDFACFNEMFEFLSEEYDRNYMPFLVESSVRHFIRPTKNRDIVGDITDNSNECNYIDRMYSLCAEITFALNNAENYDTNSAEGDDCMWQADEKFQRAKRYFLMTLDSGTKDHNILKIAYDSLMTIINVKVLDKTSYSDNYKRAVYLLMAELNEYFLKYCVCPRERFGLSIFQNRNISDIGDRRVTENVISRFLQKPLEALHRPITDYSYLDLHDFFSNSVRKSNVITRYESVIMYYWKGEKTNFNEMYGHVDSRTALNFRFFYSFYDFFFKFYIAAYYFEVNEFFIYLKTEMRKNIDILREPITDTNVIEYKETVGKFSEIYFPKTLRPFIVNIKCFSKELIDDGITIEHKEYMSKQIEKEFNAFFIVIERNNKNTSNVNEKHVKADLLFIINELVTLVKNVFHQYLMLHKYNENENYFRFKT